MLNDKLVNAHTKKNKFNTFVMIAALAIDIPSFSEYNKIPSNAVMNTTECRCAIDTIIRVSWLKNQSPTKRVIFQLGLVQSTEPFKIFSLLLMELFSLSHRLDGMEIKKKFSPSKCSILSI